jgi:hypothetical protein
MFSGRNGSMKRTFVPILSKSVICAAVLSGLLAQQLSDRAAQGSTLDVVMQGHKLTNIEIGVQLSVVPILLSAER